MDAFGRRDTAERYRFRNLVAVSDTRSHIITLFQLIQQVIAIGIRFSVGVIAHQI